MSLCYAFLIFAVAAPVFAADQDHGHSHRHSGSPADCGTMNAWVGDEDAPWAAKAYLYVGGMQMWDL